MTKCLTHGLRGFSGAVQRRLATLTVTMLTSPCWQLLTEVELRRIFDVYKQWANSGSHEFVKKNMVRYMRPHARFAHYSCKNVALTRGRGWEADVEGSCCIFKLAVRQPPVLASYIEIYYYFILLIWMYRRLYNYSNEDLSWVLISEWQNKKKYIRKNRSNRLLSFPEMLT